MRDVALGSALQSPAGSYFGVGTCRKHPAEGVITSVISIVQLDCKETTVQ